jgi:hypothetical protein
MDAIFLSAQQALYVAFLIISEPAREKMAFCLTLIRIIESIGALTRRQAAFLDYLYGERTGTVNFDGLNPLDVRAQAAMIISAVKDHLTLAERYAVWARYGRAPYKRLGVIWLSKRLRAVVNIGSLDAVKYLIAEQSMPKTERDPEKTFKYISEKTGVPVRSLERAAHIIRKQLRALENSACDKLTPMFERDGLIENRGREVSQC